MDDQRILDLLQKYREYLETLKAKAIEVDPRLLLPDRETALNHLLTMIPKMEIMLKAGKREKVFRWLGFLQGVLWLTGVYSLAELREHNR